MVTMDFLYPHTESSTSSSLPTGTPSLIVPLHSTRQQLCALQKYFLIVGKSFTAPWRTYLLTIVLNSSANVLLQCAPSSLFKYLQQPCIMYWQMTRVKDFISQSSGAFHTTSQNIRRNKIHCATTYVCINYANPLTSMQFSVLLFP